MAVAFDSKVRISLEVGDENVVFICRRPTAQEQSSFLSNRVKTKRNKVESRVIEARVEFVDSILEDVENAEYVNAKGEVKPLSASTSLDEADRAHCAAILRVPVNSWKDLIPVQWKSSVAMRFEEKESEDGAGNSRS